MLYLEDYLEMIENLPMEIREKFTEVREMDLQVQNALDNLDERVKAFFKKCGATPPPKQEWRDEQMDKIKQDFAKVVEDADEKVQLTNQVHELVDRSIRKLDSELVKFKMELEADNAGITEVLEKRSLDLESHPHDNKHGRGEKRRGHMPSSSMYGSYIPKRPTLESAIIDVGHDVSGYQRGPSSTSSSPASNMFSSGAVPPGPNSAIAVAASKAIGATHEMSQGRRTASLKASYEAINRGADLSKELQLRVLNQPPMPVSSAPLEPPITIRIQATKKRQQGGQMSQMSSHDMLSSSSSSGDIVRQQHQQEEGTSWQYDPNEPRYCLCNDVSYGEMVGCDNNDCPIEWFHYGCVGLTHAPKGKWYCPQCLAAMKRRGRK